MTASPALKWAIKHGRSTMGSGSPAHGRDATSAAV